MINIAVADIPSCYRTPVAGGKKIVRRDTVCLTSEGKLVKPRVTIRGLKPFILKADGQFYTPLGNSRNQIDLIASFDNQQQAQHVLYWSMIHGFRTKNRITIDLENMKLY